MVDDKVNDEPIVGVSGAPTPLISTEGAPPSSPADAKAYELLVNRLVRAEGEINALKSGKDKGIAKVATELAETKTRVARILELSKSNLSADQIARELAIDELLQGGKITPEPESKVETTVTPGTRPVVPEVKVESVAKMLGFEPNSAEFTEAVRLSNNPADQILSLATLAARRAEASKLNPASEMVVQTTPGNAPSVQADVATLTARANIIYNDPKASKEDIEKAQADLKKALNIK